MTTGKSEGNRKGRPDCRKGMGKGEQGQAIVEGKGRARWIVGEGRKKNRAQVEK